MNRKLPVRTYERNKYKEIIIPVPKLDILTLSNADNVNCVSFNAKLKKIRNKENNEHSMDYDPFDTTFDRLAKNARFPSRRNKSQHSRVSYNSTDNSSSWNTSKSEIIHKDVANEIIELSNINKQPISKQKGQKRKKTNMQVVKKLIIRQNQSLLSKSNKKTENKYKLRNARKNKNAILNNSNTDSCLNSGTKVNEIMDHQNIYNKVRKRKAKKKYRSERNEKNSYILSFPNSIENLYMKSCSVVVDKSDVSKWNTKKHKSSSSKEKSESTVVNHEPLQQYEFIKINDTHLENNSTNMKHCFVKVEKLEITSNIKSLGKRYENLISSTPIGKPVRPPVHLIPLSPILLTRSNNPSISAHNNDSVSLISKGMNVDFNRKHDTLEGNTSNKETKLFLINTPSISNCNLNQSKELYKKSCDSLITLNSVENNVQDQKGHLVQTEEIEMRKEMSLDVTPALIQEYTAPNVVEKQCHLNFSVDIHGSPSLFDHTKESTQTSTNNVNTASNVETISTNNLISDETNKEVNKELNNEMCSNSIKIDKEFISNINKNTADVPIDKINEESCEMSISTKSPITGTVFVDTESELRNEGIVSSDIANIDKGTDSIFNKNDTLLVNNSIVNNDKNCSAIESCTVLKQLQDPIRITSSRKRYHKWGLNVYSIPEDCDNNIQLNEDQMLFKKEDKKKRIKMSQRRFQALENVAETSHENISPKVESLVFLKPGKSWARSLSMLNNMQNECNLDQLSSGKGRKWRHSVIDILNMQKQGILQSCVKKDENDKESQVSKENHNEVPNNFDYELGNTRGRTCDSTGLGRLSKRISVRVVPIYKTVECIEDAPFLEAYGIVAVKNQRFTILSNPRKSSMCNIENDDVDGQIVEDHISTAKEVILQRCMQKDYIPFSTYFSDSYLEHCQKIGEGVYGEVFLYEEENKKSVIKIIPIEGSECVNGEPQKKFHEILSEIVIAMELHNLRFNASYNTDGFVEVKNIKCIRGKYPEQLVELWNMYDEEKHSDNDSPLMFNDDQLYIVLELGHGGQDLEAFVFYTAEEAYTLFIQAALALSVAEKAVEFEHRDLHWGNILISPTNESHVYYKLGQKQIKVVSKGVKVSIIDFTLSRVSYQGCSVFNDLASDPTLFTAQGEYQFEIYRLMKDKLNNCWQKFEPYTNILWLHYTLDKMITAVRYRKRNLKIHKNGIVKLKELKNEILMYNSVFDFVTNCDKIASMLVNDSKSEFMPCEKN